MQTKKSGKLTGPLGFYFLPDDPSLSRCWTLGNNLFFHEISLINHNDADQSLQVSTVH